MTARELLDEVIEDTINQVKAFNFDTEKTETFDSVDDFKDSDYADAEITSWEVGENSTIQFNYEDCNL